MGQVLSFIWSFMCCADGGSKGGDQTPTDDHYHDHHSEPNQLTHPWQQQPEIHSLTIYDPLLSPSDPITRSNDIDIYNNNTSTLPCTVLDLSRVNDVEDEEKVVEVVVVEENPSKGKNRKKKKKKNKNAEGSTTTTNNIAEGVTVSTSGGDPQVGRIGAYTSTQRILLVGEGDFSFSACLAVAFGTASYMVATSLNTKEFLLKNYGKFLDNNNELLTRGCVVLHGVDATKMAKHPQLCTRKFDRIVYNFPHSGFHTNGSLEPLMHRHQKLVSGFLRNAKTMIANNDGEIHVTHKSNFEHLKWNIPKLASDQGLYLIQEIKFKRIKYPGYHTKFGFGGNDDFNCNPSKTYKFGLAAESALAGAKSWATVD